MILLVAQPGQAVLMCESAEARVLSYYQSFKQCSPYSPYAIHCYYVSVWDPLTGTLITAKATICYPTQL